MITPHASRLALLIDPSMLGVDQNIRGSQRRPPLRGERAPRGGDLGPLDRTLSRRGWTSPRRLFVPFNYPSFDLCLTGTLLSKHLSKKKKPHGI